MIFLPSCSRPTIILVFQVELARVLLFCPGAGGGGAWQHGLHPFLPLLHINHGFLPRSCSRSTPESTSTLNSFSGSGQWWCLAA
eukprot:56883-Pelagomonas_calceolata.AAC.3